jgi:chromosomal replication initiation ATPase DnaA
MERTPPRGRPASDIAIINRIASAFGVSEADVYSRRLAPPAICLARHACFIAFRRLGYSLPVIGRLLSVHHTTVMNGIDVLIARAVGDLRAEGDVALAVKVDRLLEAT